MFLLNRIFTMIHFHFLQWLDAIDWVTEGNTILTTKVALRNNKCKYKLLCPRGTQTCALAVANIAHAVYLLDVAKRPIPQG